MLALYRSGRQADALRSYQDARLLLIEELGLEPVEELKRLERAILVHDAALDAPQAGHPPPPAPRGREARRTVTVLFADVTSSKALGEPVDPESLRELIGRFFGELATTIRKYGGTVEKVAGDAVMALFGGPLAHRDDALRAARAALQMQTVLVALNVEFA